MLDDKVFDVVLDDEERKIAESVENGEWKTVSNFQEEKSLAQLAAAHYLQKNARINIRLSSHDLMKLKQKAAYKGLPYQTFIASILHEYAAGHFQEKL